jgi:hypothetical protein
MTLPATMQQLNIFDDRSDVMLLRNDELESLQRRDATVRRTALERLASEYSGGALPAMTAPVRELEDGSMVPFADHTALAVACWHFEVEVMRAARADRSRMGHAVLAGAEALPDGGRWTPRGHCLRNSRGWRAARFAEPVPYWAILRPTRCAGASMRYSPGTLARDGPAGGGAAPRTRRRPARSGASPSGTQPLLAGLFDAYMATRKVSAGDQRVAGRECHWPRRSSRYPQLSPRCGDN